jgi:hypothetical protein
VDTIQAKVTDTLLDNDPDYGPEPAISLKRCGQSTQSSSATDSQSSETSPSKSGSDTKKYPDARKCLQEVKTHIDPTFNTDTGLENVCNYPIRAFDCSRLRGMFPCQAFNQPGGPTSGSYDMQPHDVIGMYSKHIYGACPFPALAAGHFDGSNVMYHCEAGNVDDTGGGTASPSVGTGSQ